MSGKKGKKTKGKTIPLNDFLGDTPAPLPTKAKAWADCMDDDDDFSYSSRPKDTPIVLPSAPRAARDLSVNEENIPNNPPFVAYISNLPYDVDEEDLSDFFADMNVSKMRLPKDQNKFKGYGYVEFEDRQSLIDALSMADTHLKTRRVRIEVSNNSSDDRRGRMGRMGERRDYSDDPERTTGDWRSARSGPGGFVNDDDDREGGGRDDRFRSRGGFDRRDDNRDSGFEDTKPGNWRDGPREAAADRPRTTFNRGGPGEGGGERDWSRFSDRRGPGPRDGSRERDGGDRGSSFGPRRTYGDDMDRDRERWGSLRSAPREPLDGPPRDSEGPRARPKLNLAPRSKPVENAAPQKDGDGEDKEQKQNGTDHRPAPTHVPAANIFGAAKPVDTAAREREIEERLAKSAEARKEEDSERRGPREGIWGRRNGDDSDSRSRPTWRSNREMTQRETQSSQERRDYRDERGDSRGPPMGRNAGPPPLRSDSQGPPKDVRRASPDGRDGEKKVSEEEEVSRMPKAKDDQAPNFIASNKYSMLPDDVDPDNVEE